MALNPTLRSSQGTPLTELQADDNWTLLAQNATTGQQGNVQLTDQVNVTSSVLGATATAVKTAYDEAVTANTKTLVRFTLFSNPTGELGTFAINNKSAYDLIEVEWRDQAGVNYGVVVHFQDNIVDNRRYIAMADSMSSSGGALARYEFDSDTSMTVTQGTNDSLIDGITLVTGMRYA